MRFILFILFVIMPFVELALLIKLGNVLGFWPTIAIVLFSAIVGAYVLHSQGLATMHRVSQSIRSGEPPIMPVVDGFFIAIAGAFLLTPGLITDCLGLSLLVPQVRRAVARWAFGRVVQSGSFKIHTYTTGGAPSGSHPGANKPKSDQPLRPGRSSPPRARPTDEIIDAEFEEIKKKK